MTFKRKRLIPAVIGVISLLLGGCSFPFIKPNYAGLQVESTPEAAVYLDGKHVGSTKYFEEKLNPTNYIVKLVPLAGNVSPWETQITLQPGKTTIINKEFGATPSESSNYILQLEKIANKKTAELSIITTPENVIVRLDDQPKGFSPLTNLGVTPDTHKVTLSVPGYKTLNINVNTIVGYRVLLTAELGKALALQPTASSSASSILPETTIPSSASASPKPSPTAIPTTQPTATLSASPKPTPSAQLSKPYVEILATPTGWLRVRSEPNGLSENEVAKVNTGESFAYIESNDTGWHKIEYTPGKQGWISATYSKIVK